MASALTVVPAHLLAAQKAEARRIDDLERVGWAFANIGTFIVAAEVCANHTEVSIWHLAGERVLARAVEAA